MKKTRRSTFFIITVLIIAFTYLSFAGLCTYYGDNKIVYLKGVQDIRWGIDIQGGVEAVFTPDIEPEKITSDDMKKAEAEKMIENEGNEENKEESKEGEDELCE